MPSAEPSCKICLWLLFPVLTSGLVTFKSILGWGCSTHFKRKVRIEFKVLIFLYSYYLSSCRSTQIFCRVEAKEENENHDYISAHVP